MIGGGVEDFFEQTKPIDSAISTFSPALEQVVRLNFEQIYLPKFTNSRSIVDSELLYNKEPLEISF